MVIFSELGLFWPVPGYMFEMGCDSVLILNSFAVDFNFATFFTKACVDSNFN